MRSLARPLTESATRYAWRELSSRAIGDAGASGQSGLEALGIEAHYAPPNEVNAKNRSVTVEPCDSYAWDDLLARPADSLQWITASEALPSDSALPFDGPIPVLFWGAGCESDDKPFAEQRADGGIVFHADIIAASLFMLSRWEETVVPDRDEHGRFPATASVAYKQGFLDRSIVDEYALILREWLKALLPRWKPKKRSYTVQLSHDVDHVLPFRGITHAARSVAGDLVRRRSLRRVYHTMCDAAAQLGAPEKSSYARGVNLLADISLENGLRNDVFYFMAQGPGPVGGGYDPTSPLVRRCIADLERKGFEIGLHASYDSLGQPESLEREKSRLEAVARQPVTAVRQHYLRFKVPDTWRHMEAAGLACDSTMAYARYEGFRCGTCHPFHPYDLDKDRELCVQEVPLIATDGTLYRHRGMAPPDAARRILALARRCEFVEGTFSMLWHNSSLSGAWLPWVPVYREVVRDLACSGDKGGIRS